MTAAFTLDAHDRVELEAHRAGIGHLAEDPMHAGQPVHVEYRYTDDEPIYRLQVTHAMTPLWQCERCRKLTLGVLGETVAVCLACGTDTLHPLLYSAPVTCRTESGRPGPCLIAGSDGCDCSGI